MRDNYIGKVSFVKSVLLILLELNAKGTQRIGDSPGTGSHCDEIKLAKVTCLALNYGIIQKTLLSASQQG